MRLFDAIIDANHRALDGDKTAGFHLTDYAGELPVVAMTCIDPRLNRLFPGVMGLPAEGFIWLRNAGNIIFGPLSSMTRSLSLACAVKGGREIAIIGHTDCQICRTSIPELVEKYRALGIERNQLPENLAEYFGVFSSERQNVIQSTEIVRSSPIISPHIPVQGLMVDVNTGRLEWVVNGYDVLARKAAATPTPTPKLPEIGGALGNLTDRIGGGIRDLKIPERKIGELATEVKQLLSELKPETVPSQPPPIPPAARKSIPVPPPIHMNQGLRPKKN
jgi:carbonic anhydrase